MSTMYISEYEELASSENGMVQAGREPSVTTQKVTFTGTAGASAAFNSRTKFIRVSCDAAAFLAFGLDPTAVTATDLPVQASTPEYFGVIPGQKISAVA